MKKKKSSVQTVGEALVLILQLGLNMIVPILICTMAGMFIDKRFGLSYATIIGIIIGIIAGFNGAYRLVKGYLKNPERPSERAKRLEKEANEGNKLD